MPRELTLGECAVLACLLEAVAPKPGNVHRGADFEDLTFNDFMVSASTIGAPMDDARQTGVGAAVLGAIRRTRKLVSTNTNLGIVLLFAPLAAVPEEQSLEQGVEGVLASLTAADARQVYQAIREAEPGGLGKAEEMDVAESPPDDLLAAMRAAAPRDLVARQYAENFATVLGEVMPWVVEGRAIWTLTDTIVHAHVRLMATYPDSLIARKCGLETARESAARAGRVLEAGSPGNETYHAALADLDFWLRSDGHRRNPGATADLIAAGLFAALREELISPPYR